MTEEAVLGPAPVRTRPEGRVASAARACGRSGGRAGSLQLGSRWAPEQARRGWPGDTWRGLEGGGGMAGAGGWRGPASAKGSRVPSLPSWPPPPPQPFQGSQRSARKTRQRGAGPKACTRVAGRGRLPGDDFGQQQKTPQRSGRLTRGTPGVPTCPLRAGPRFQTAERDFSTWPSGTWTPVRAQGRGSPRGDRTRVCVVHACCVSV